MAALREEWSARVAIGSAAGERLPWRRNETPSGVWAVLPLVSQGQPDDAVLRASPVAAELAGQLAHCMAAAVVRPAGAPAGQRGSNVFANVMWSVLWPNSTIEPHCGPTNVRYRVHLPVCVDRSASSTLTVGGIARYSGRVS